MLKSIINVNKQEASSVIASLIAALPLFIEQKSTINAVVISSDHSKQADNVDKDVKTEKEQANAEDNSATNAAADVADMGTYDDDGNREHTAYNKDHTANDKIVDDDGDNAAANAVATTDPNTAAGTTDKGGYIGNADDAAPIKSEVDDNPGVVDDKEMEGFHDKGINFHDNTLFQYVSSVAATSTKVTTPIQRHL